MFFVTLEFHNDELEKDQQEIDAFLVRLKRLANGMVRQYVYYRSSTTNGYYTLFYVTDVNAYTGMQKVVGPIKKKDADLELLNGVMTRLIPVVKHALYTIITFEPAVKNDPTGSFQLKKHVAKAHQDKYLEYTLDLNKSRGKNYGTHKLGGKHASPIEHVRMGHERKYKTGKKVWIDDITVNKGMGGRIEKDYKL
jgi:hypothetical protein